MGMSMDTAKYDGLQVWLPASGNYGVLNTEERIVELERALALLHYDIDMMASKVIVPMQQRLGAHTAIIAWAGALFAGWYYQPPGIVVAALAIAGFMVWLAWASVQDGRQSSPKAMQRLEDKLMLDGEENSARGHWIDKHINWRQGPWLQKERAMRDARDRRMP